MLKISLDESYVFDLLSIHEVKLNASTGSKREQVLKSLISLRNEILQSANKLVFELVDRAGETKLSKETADANYQRYIRKTELQAKFFNNSLSEVKI
jgi:DNA polymerase IIIc chi subunit